MKPIEQPYLLYVGDVTDDTFAKTATGIAHWRPESCVGLWRADPGLDHYGLPRCTFEEAVARGARTLVVGVAPDGGELPRHWVEELGRALQAGLHLAAGLHTRLRQIPELAESAAKFQREVHDVRYPDDLSLDVGHGAPRSGRRLLTVGTDCAVGKMFTALEIERQLQSRGVAATFRATGQTGIFIAGSGIAVDAVVSDFISGAAESLSPPNDPDHWDVIEGQGSLFHPAYAGVSLGLLHGSQPDALVLCHRIGRHLPVGVEHCVLPSLAECIRANEQAAHLTNQMARVVGISVNTVELEDEEAREYLAGVGEELGLPVGDPVRTGLDAIVDEVMGLPSGR